MCVSLCVCVKVLEIVSFCVNVCVCVYVCLYVFAWARIIHVLCVFVCECFMCVGVSVLCIFSFWIRKLSTFFTAVVKQDFFKLDWPFLCSIGLIKVRPPSHNSQAEAHEHITQHKLLYILSLFTEPFQKDFSVVVRCCVQEHLVSSQPAEFCLAAFLDLDHFCEPQFCRDQMEEVIKKVCLEFWHF